MCCFKEKILNLSVASIECVTMILIILLFATVFAYVFWSYYVRRSPFKEPPACEGALPLIGHAHLLIGDSAYLWGMMKDLAYQSLRKGGLVSASIGPQTVYVLTDPDDYLTVANTCLQKAVFYDFAKPWLGEGLVTGKLSIWKVHRKLLNPAFSQVVLDGFLGVFNSQARVLVKDFASQVGQPPFDHWSYLKNNALETICLTALGANKDGDSHINSQYVDATDTMFNILVDRFQKFWMHVNFIYNLTSLKKKQDEVLRILHNKSYTVLQQRKAEFILNGNKCAEPDSETKPGVIRFKPFLDLLLELAAEKKAFTDIEIRQQVDTMIVGGHDTSASVLMYTIVMIGSHPEVQKKIYDELQEVFDNSDRDVEKQDLTKLVYLEAVIKETLRMFPIVPIVARYLHKDVKLKNYTLTAGRTCFMFIYGLSRHERWGSDAEEFKPERWLDPATLPDTSLAFAGFSMGRRVCIGKAYALMSMKTTLAHLLRHYKIKADYTKLVLKLDVMLKPVTGHHITLEKWT